MTDHAMPTTRLSRHAIILWRLLLLISVPVKLIAAHHAPFDHDYVPVVAYGWQWLQGVGDSIVPAYGTLSSVGAYNMPMLVWLYTPIQVLFQDAFAVFFLTGLALNALGAWALWRLVTALAGTSAGWIATTLFLFSEVAISSSYTAWAQLQLPTFFAIATYCAWRWWAATTTRHASVWLALMGIITFMTFMIHFAAVMLFVALFVGAIAVRARWTWQGLLGGALVCAVLIAPYAIFQHGRDWMDLRAFLTREPFIAQERLDDIQTRITQPDALIPTTPDAIPTPESTRIPDPDALPRWQRAFNLAMMIPAQIVDGFLLPMRLGNAQAGWLVVFALVALVRVALWVARGLWQVRGRFWQVAWRDDERGRVALVVLLWLVFVLALILTRNTPQSQATYYMGTISWYVVLVASGIVWSNRAMVSWWVTPTHQARILWGAMALIVGIFVAGNSIERIERVRLWDEERTDAANIWQYRHIASVANYIAEHSDNDEITVVYDLLRYQPQLWWVGAWHDVDGRYTAGMPFDHLLWRDYGIRNRNQDAFGGVDEATLAQADFIVTTVAGATQYIGEQVRIGGLVLMMPE